MPDEPFPAAPDPLRKAARPSPATGPTETVESLERPPNRRLVRYPETPRVSLLVCHLVLAGVTAGVFLAGGPPQGSLGIVLVCLGAALLCCPPQIKVDKKLWLAAAGLLVGGALAFLPEHWFGVPAWRQALEAIPAMHLPSTVTPVPWETAFWLAVLALSTLTGLFLLAHPVRSAALVWCAVVTVFACGMYAALAIYAKKEGWHYPFDGGASFGFFPNRNHTATLLVTGSIVAMGLLGIVPSQRRWGAGALAAASLTTCVAALFYYSGSRGGVVFLLVGTAAWVAGLGRAWRNPRLLVSVSVLLIAGGCMLLVSRSEVRNRLVASAVWKGPVANAQDDASPDMAAPAPERPVRESENVPADFRLLIYRDAAAMIAAFPVTGSGLGTFAYDFAQYRRASLSESSALHPESDWLMLMAEAGVPTLLCAVALCWLAASRLGKLRDHPYWPLRWGFVAAAGTAALHGLVDVPLHRVQLGWWILVLAGLGLQVNRGNGDRSRIQHGIFVLGGLGAILLGVRLIQAEWYGGRALPPFAAERAQRELLDTFHRGDTWEAMNMASRAVAASQMSAPLYYQWGVLMLHFEDSEAETDAAFKAQRLLNPVWPNVPLWQGDAWAPLESKRTAKLWLDALNRHQRIEHLVSTPPAENGIKYFRSLLTRAAKFPGVRAELGTVVGQSPSLALAWLEDADPSTAAPPIGRVLTDEELLKRFSPREREQWLLLCNAKGDRAVLSRFLSEHPDWQASAWPLHLKELTESGLTEEAVREAAEHYHISLELPSSTLDGGETSVPPRQADDPVSLSKQYWREGNPVAARRMLEVAMDTSGPQSPLSAEYWRLRAAISAHDRSWGQAWQALERYIQLLHPTEVLP